ncbi:hypothetical protein QTP88_003007 [Uroleucon formosanum]
MLHVLGEMVRENILFRIKKSGVFSFIIDTTTDVSNIEQLSLVIRFINENEDVEERLVALENVSDARGIGMFNVLCNICEKYGIDWENQLCAQSYDGASSMQGQYSGVRAYIQEKNPRAIYVWCFSHILNLVVVDTCDTSKTMRNFFGDLQSLIAFLRARKRAAIFLNQQKVCYPEERVCRMKNFSSTRWTSHDRALTVIFEKYKALNNTLQELSNSTERDTSSMATNLLSTISSFKFVTHLLLMKNIFKHTSPLSIYLQSPSLDFIIALTMVDNCARKLSELRNELHLDILLAEAKKLFCDFENVESYHRHLKDQFYNPHPSIYNFIEVIKEHQAEVYLKLQSNGQKSTNRKSKVISNIKTWTLYKEKKISRLEYLKTDELSRYALAIALVSTDAPTVAQAFVECYVCTYGIPKSILTDCGTNFLSDVFKGMCKLLDIDKAQTTPWHPSFVDKDSNWDKLLCYATFCYNITVHTSTNFTPYELVFGTKHNIPLAFNKNLEPQYNYDNYVFDLKRMMQEAHKIARDNLIKKKKTNKTYYDKTINSIDIHVGDKVLLKEENKKNALSQNWTGPYKVMERERQLKDFLHKHFVLVGLMLTKHMAETNTLIEIIQQAKIEVIHPSLITPPGFLEQVKDIKVSLPGGTDLPTDLDIANI